MKKKHILILSIVAVIILVVVAIWIIAYNYFSNRIDNSTKQNFIDKTISYLSTDEEFIDKYGVLISAESEDKLPLKNEASDVTEYYMDFICITEKGEFHIRVYHTWLDAWTYSFEEIHIN